MDNIYKKISYLKGYAEGVEIDESTDEGKIILGILDVLNDLAEAVEDFACDIEETAERVDMLEDDMDSLEDCYCDFDDDLDDDLSFDDCDDIDIEDEFFEIECPNCKEDVLINFDDIEKGIVCPHCNEEIELEFDCDDDLDSEDFIDKK